MAPFRQKYCADFFKKNQENSNSTSSEVILKQESKLDLESKEVQSEEYDYGGSFENEDILMARLYRALVEDIKDISKMAESQVTRSIHKMKEQIYHGQMKGFGRFGGIDFCKPSNRCGYLITYATCHTGLVKKVVWQFFQQKRIVCKLKTDILKTKKLKVVSLGGGPGNDLVGFCSALQEIRKHVQKTRKHVQKTRQHVQETRKPENEIDFKIIDTSQAWVSMFPTILKKAKYSDFGRLSELLKEVKITTGFMQADLNKDDIFEDKNLCSVLGEADLILMVKLFPDLETETLIQNIADAMQVESLMIFIGQPFDKKLFDRIQCLLPVYHHYQKYKMSFDPLKHHSLAISASQAHIGVFEKCPK